MHQRRRTACAAGLVPGAAPRVLRLVCCASSCQVPQQPRRRGGRHRYVPRNCLWPLLLCRTLDAPRCLTDLAPSSAKCCPAGQSVAKMPKFTIEQLRKVRRASRCPPGAPRPRSYCCGRDRCCRTVLAALHEVPARRCNLGSCSRAALTPIDASMWGRLARLGTEICLRQQAPFRALPQSFLAPLGLGEGRLRHCMTAERLPYQRRIAARCVARFSSLRRSCRRANSRPEHALHAADGPAKQHPEHVCHRARRPRCESRSLDERVTALRGRPASSAAHHHVLELHERLGPRAGKSTLTDSLVAAAGIIAMENVRRRRARGRRRAVACEWALRA